MEEERTLVSFDYAVKYLLRDKADFVILSGFLTELLKRKVEVLAILESESNKVKPGEKINRVDLKAEIDDGELAVFEFQFNRDVDFFDRVLYGVCKAVTEQVESGKKYEIKKVYSINIAYHDIPGAKKEYLFFNKSGGFKGVHFKKETVRFGNLETDGNDIHPEYYLILPNKFDEKLRDDFDEWIHVLKHSAVPESYNAKGIAEAKIKLDLLRMSPEERKAYETYLENRASVDSAIDTAKHEGLTEGLAKGKVEGRQEASTEIAKNMKTEGIDINTIVKLTKLSIKEIEQL